MQRLILLLTIVLLSGIGCKLSAQTNIEDFRNSYCVSGLDAKTVRKSLTGNTTCIENGKKFDAYTSWNLSWRYQWVGSDGRFTLSRFYTRVKSTITMPDWVDRDKADAKLVQKWDKYYDALLKHEMGHRQIAIDAANKIHLQLKNIGVFPSGKALAQVADKIANDGLEEARRIEKQYDIETNHGMRDGARFP